MNKHFLPLLLSVSTLFTQAQTSGGIKIYKSQGTSSFSNQNLFQSLVGEGIILKSYSVSKTPSDEAFGFFEDDKESLGMKKGLIMTTGGISSMCGRNTSTCMSNSRHDSPQLRTDVHEAPTTRSYELEKLLKNGKKTFDACVLEMDIIPTADTLSFNYIFGSEEYDEFVGTDFNDVFAFFISGEGITGEKNLAVIPGTDIPVSINTINNGASGTQGRNSSNPGYYISNVSGSIAIEYDGLTKLMHIRQPVKPYQTYHIKLAIADVSDNSYDSGVLIEGKSFISYKKSYNALFAKNSCVLEKEYKTFLNGLAAQYKNNKGKILVTGHTDNEGSEEVNTELSCCRANAVADYFKSKGIDASRIIIECKGESNPEYSNTTEQGKVWNRRVEVKLLGDDEQYLANKKSEIVKDEKAKMISNFPNPFSGYTTIEAYIAEETKDASIVISDMTGGKIKIIHVLERGKTSAQFDGTLLANGTYFATLLVDGQTNGTVKMIVTH
ncbi:MAG TPA: choice-of-anchor L domain-containing protein [Bacteroidia bacterium]|jgi:outer membrane protein OmpA-like peptidoglycan-associated protein|nr:choice-of-anchor L domain-containing protein [Bacteroidia bacterium]